MLERLAERSKRDPVTGCLLWAGALTEKGYGEIHIRVDGRRKKRRVHRVTWEEVFGPILSDLIVCHTCDTPNCRELDHLFLGTEADNSADMVAKGRQWHPHGVLAKSSVLTDDKARAIFAAGGSQRAIAKRYGIGKSTVGAIKRGEAWRHVTGL